MRDVDEGPRRPRRAEEAGGVQSGSMPRRRFLEVSATATVGALALQTGAEAAAAAGEPGPRAQVAVMPALMMLSAFEPCLGETFRARDGSGAVHDLVLVEAKALEPRPGLARFGIREDPFSLLFQAPASPSLEQGTYAMENPRLGALDIFIVPVGFRRPTDPIILQAIFG